MKSIHADLDYELNEIKLDKLLSKEQSQKLLKTIFALPSNVLEVSNAVVGLIQTSNNLGIVETENDYLKISCLLRSSDKNSMNKYSHKIISLLELGDFRAKLSGEYLGWNLDPNTKIVNIAKESYKELTGKEAKVCAIHAGLECGLLKGKYPGVEMISLGPEIIGAHTPKEKVSIDSVKNSYILTKNILEKYV